MARSFTTASVALYVVFFLIGCSESGEEGFGEVLDPAAAGAVEDVQGDVAATDDASDIDRDPIEDADDPVDISGELISDYDLQNGECFNRLEDLQSGRYVVITARVDCEQPHQNEVYHTFEIEAEHPSVFPGDAPVTAYARSRCYDNFEAFVGEEYELSVYEIGVFIPNRVNFEHSVARYRGVHCWLYHRDGDLLVGSAQNTAI